MITVFFPVCSLLFFIEKKGNRERAMAGAPMYIVVSTLGIVSRLLLINKIKSLGISYEEYGAL